MKNLSRKHENQETSDVRPRTTAGKLAVLSVVAMLFGFGLYFGCETRWLQIGGALSIGASQFALIIDAYRRRELQTNWGQVAAASNPIWFRMELALWSSFAIALTSLLLLRAVGVIGTSEP